jgi:hypothetical protein
MHAVYKGVKGGYGVIIDGEWARGLRQMNTCRNVPLEVNIFRWRHFDLVSVQLISLLKSKRKTERVKIEPTLTIIKLMINAQLCQLSSGQGNMGENTKRTILRRKDVPSNAHISTPFFQKTVFFSKICFGNPPQIFGGMTKFGIYVIMKSSLQF